VTTADRYDPETNFSAVEALLAQADNVPPPGFIGRDPAGDNVRGTAEGFGSDWCSHDHAEFGRNQQRDWEAAPQFAYTEQDLDLKGARKPYDVSNMLGTPTSA
jgi:hypothetical protein